MVKIILAILIHLNLIGNSYEISSYDKEQFKLINEYRVQNNIPPLQWSTEMYNLAKDKTQHMIKFDYFGHTSPAGVTLQQRLHNTHGKAENLAKGFNTPKSCLEALKESETHNFNLLDTRSTVVGIYTEGSCTTQIFGDNTIS